MFYISIQREKAKAILTIELFSIMYPKNSFKSIKVIIISSENEDTSPTPAFKKLLQFINTDLGVNKPVDIQTIADETGLSWTYIKKLLTQLKKDQYEGFHFEKLGNSWIIWKDRDHILKHLEDTCGKFLDD